MNVKALCNALSTRLPFLECSETPKGVLVRTPFLYPDGDYIDVFVLEQNGEIAVTDYGEALGWLRMQMRNEDLSPAQRRLFDDVCLTLGVESFHGQLIRRAPPEDIADAVLSVAQAAVRVADLCFTTQARTMATGTTR